MATIQLEIPDKEVQRFLKFMKTRLIMEDLFPEQNPCDGICLLVARAMTDETNNSE